MLTSLHLHRILHYQGNGTSVKTQKERKRNEKPNRRENDRNACLRCYYCYRNHLSRPRSSRRCVSQQTQKAGKGKYMEYAANVPGIALFAYDSWVSNRRMSLEQNDIVDKTLLIGRAGAYATIVRQATGRHPGWFKDKDALESFLGTS